MKKSTRFLAVMLSILLLLGAVPGSFAAGSISTPAAGAVVMDFQTGELYFAKNADKARPAASMTKLMSAYMILEEISSGRLAPDTLVTASDKAAAISRNPAYSGMERLTAGQSYPADTLLKLALVHSCNGSIIALAEHVGGGSEEAFVQRMNEKTAEWGLDARFADSSGFIDRGNAVSPRAMAEIGRHILIDHPEVLNYTSLHSVTFQGKTFNSTNTLMRNGTVEGIDGFKTGCTDGAGYCFTGTASRDGRRMISVVMGADSYRSRMSESRKLLEYGFTCRAEREAAWAKTADRVRADIKSEDGLAHSFMKNHFTATMSGVEGTIPCSVSWDVGGQVVDMGMTTISNGSVLELVCTPPPTASSLPVTLSLTLPNGHVVRQESRIKAAPPLTFSGYMGIGAISLYPGVSLRIPCQVWCDQGTISPIPAGWYLDGEPLKGFQNPGFVLAPQGMSSYLFTATEDMEPSVHILEFRCNPQGLPGAEQASFSMTLEILSLDQPQAA